MNLRSAVTIATTAFAALALGSCGGRPVAYIYDTCSASEQCPGATLCLSANTTTDGFVGSFCTVSCTFDSDCPLDGYAPPVCEGGQCYAGCPSGGGCPYGERCATDGQVLFCVP